VLNRLRRGITDAQVPLEGQSSEPRLGLTDQVDSQKPDDQRKLGVLKERSRDERCLMIAKTTLEGFVPAALQWIRQPVTASGARESSRPTFPFKSLFTLGFIAELLMEFENRHAFLELYGVDSDG
jgi:hypothetical protein